MAAAAASAPPEARLRAFLASSGVEVDTRAIRIASGGAVMGGVGVVAAEDIAEGQVVARIPKAAALSAASSPHAAEIEGAGFHTSEGELAAALALEAAKGASSRWADYIGSLPAGVAGCLPGGWAEEDAALLRGTELEGCAEDDRAARRQEWESAAKGLFATMKAQLFVSSTRRVVSALTGLSFDAYVEAHALVSSRQFHVDEHHGAALLPLADAFNHKCARLNFARDGGVSVSRPREETGCGDAACSDDDCGHNHDHSHGREHEHENQDDHDESHKAEESDDDADESEDDLAAAAVVGAVAPQLLPKSERTTRRSGIEGMDIAFVDVGDALAIVAMRPLSAGAEVFNCYGEIASGTLVHDYGFAPACNPLDIVNLETADLIDAATEEVGAKAVRAALRALPDGSAALPDYLQLGRLADGLDDDLEQVMLVLTGEQGRLGRKGRRVLARALRSRAAAYARKGGAEADAARARLALAQGRGNAATAYALATAEQSVLEEWERALGGAKRKRT